MNETISTYYDRQMSDLELIHFEANMVLSEKLREQCAKNCYEYFIITNSIKLAKMRSAQRAKVVVNDFISIKKEKRLPLFLVDIYTIVFKSFYKHNRDVLLNINRNNPQ